MSAAEHFSSRYNTSAVPGPDGQAVSSSTAVPGPHGQAAFSPSTGPGPDGQAVSSSIFNSHQLSAAGCQWWSAGGKAGRTFGFSASNFLSIAVAIISGSGKSVQGPSSLISWSCSSFEEEKTTYCIAILVAGC
jgi:hypothetical protein